MIPVLMVQSLQKSLDGLKTFVPCVRLARGIIKKSEGLILKAGAGTGAWRRRGSHGVMTHPHILLTPRFLSHMLFYFSHIS